MDSECCFKRVCDQIVLFNLKLFGLLFRYIKVSMVNYCFFRYSLRLRFVVVEGFRDMYYDYVYSKVQIVVDLWYEMFGENVQIIVDDMLDFELDEDY